MSGDDTVAGLSPRHQLVLIAVAGVALVLASYLLGSPVDTDSNPLLFGVGAVCLLYAGLRGLYEWLR